MRNDYENFNNNWTFFLTVPLAAFAGSSDGTGEPTQTELVQDCQNQFIFAASTDNGSIAELSTEAVSDVSDQTQHLQAYLACIQEVMTKDE